MAVGFQAHNDTGVVQIDGENLNIYLARKETVMLTNPSPNGSGFELVAAVGIDPGDLVAFSCSTHVLLPTSMSIDGTPGFPLWGFTSGFWVESAEGPTASGVYPVTFYVFKTAPPPAGTFGLQVFSSSGALVYDSSWKLFKPVSILEYSSAPQSLPAGRTYALVYMALQTNARWYEDLYLFRIQYWAARISGTTVSWVTGDKDNTFYFSGVSPGPSKCIVIDVTGY